LEKNIEDIIDPEKQKEAEKVEKPIKKNLSRKTYQEKP
jgi:hypothetical protein